MLLIARFKLIRVGKIGFQLAIKIKDLYKKNKLLVLFIYSIFCIGVYNS